MWEEAKFEKQQFLFRERTFWNSNESKKIDNWNIDLRWVFNKCHLDQNTNSSTEGKCINPNKNLLGNTVYSK